MSKIYSEAVTWHIDTTKHSNENPSVEADVIYIDVSQYQAEPASYHPSEGCLRRMTASLHQAADRVDTLTRTIERFCW
jgi:hypothetical protein